MKLICVLGRAGSGKTRYVIHKIGQSKSRALLIVPNQYTLSAERDIIKKLGLKGFIDIEVLSFTRLLERVLDISGGALYPSLNNRGKSMILTKLLSENKKSLDAFKAYTNSPSFALSVAEAIAELKRFNIGPEDLKSAAESPRHEELAFIYKQYNEYIKDKYLDSQDKMNLMIKKLGESEFVKDADVYIDGFEMLTGQIYRVVEALVREAKSVTVTFRLGGKTDRDFHIFSTEYKHYQRIKDIAEQVGAEIEEIRLPQQNAPWGETRNTGAIRHLEKNLFSMQKNKAKSADGIKAFCSNNMAEEAEICAAEILGLARDKNYRWRDIALICDNIAEYEPYLKKAFKDCGIPCFLDIKRPAAAHAYSRYILQLIAVIKNNFSSRDVVSLLKTGFTAFEFSECDEYEELIRISGLKWLTEKSSLKAESYDNLKEKLLNGLFALDKKLRTDNSAAAMAQNFYNYLIEAGSVARAEEFIHNLTANNMLDEAAEATAAYNAVCSVLEQLHEVLSDVKLTVADFYNIILSGLQAEDLAVIPPNMDSVSLGTLQRSRLSDIRVLFIIGANEGSFPAQMEENCLITADDKAGFTQKGFYLGHDEIDRAAKEELNIYTAVSKPTERLYVSYTLKSARGDEAIPSQTVNDILNCFEALQIEFINRKVSEEIINTYDSTLLYAVKNISERLQKSEPLEVWDMVRNEYLKAGDKRIERALVFRNAYHDELSRQFSDSLYSKSFPSTRLETFAKCPFLHFVEYGLKLKERTEYEYTQKDYGKYYHKALEEFVKSCTKIGWEGLTDGITESMINHICDRLDETVLHGGHEDDAREKHNLSVIRRKLKSAARAVLKQMQNGLFRPEAVEAAFNGEVALDIGKGIRLTGRIDRLDTYEKNGRKYVRVVDYKSGNEKFEPVELYYGTALQLPLYLSAVLTKPNYEPAGMFIMPLKENIIRETDETDLEGKKVASHKLHGVFLAESDIVLAMDKYAMDGSDIIPVIFNQGGSIRKSNAAKDKQQLEKILEFGKKKAQELAIGIMEGTAKPSPYKGKLNSCQYCLLKGTCGFEKMRGDRARFTTSVDLKKIMGENA